MPIKNKFFRFGNMTIKNRWREYFRFVDDFANDWWILDESVLWMILLCMICGDLGVMVLKPIDASNKKTIRKKN